MHFIQIIIFINVIIDLELIQGDKMSFLEKLKILIIIILIKENIF